MRHDFRPSDTLPGPAGQKKIADDFRAAFPDLEVTVDLIIGEQDFVVGRWPLDGDRHSPRIMGWARSERAAGQLLGRQHLFASSRGRSRRFGITATTSAFYLEQATVDSINKRP